MENVTREGYRRNAILASDSAYGVDFCQVSGNKIEIRHASNTVVPGRVLGKPGSIIAAGERLNRSAGNRIFGFAFLRFRVYPFFPTSGAFCSLSARAERGSRKFLKGRLHSFYNASVERQHRSAYTRQLDRA